MLDCCVSYSLTKMDNTASLPLSRACEVAGGSTRLAELLTSRGRKTSKASISRWKSDRVPAEACPDIEALTGVKCEELRPDVRWDVLRTSKAKRKAIAANDTERARA
jgi:DNA-binding transcriptional regulator YdaS (Cro superfamily)